ncbi:hypothetical protein E2C01_011736 [Portunus trituberculatus]|uniref:Uncharacterized protein n=1 Tax=Portunus trituberculatus TaxID=210409 RepID=A0A5B7DBU6_PORTR|nr:hypothetical protein [Portunus trituberculatus]
MRFLAQKWGPYGLRPGPCALCVLISACRQGDPESNDVKLHHNTPPSSTKIVSNVRQQSKGMFFFFYGFIVTARWATAGNTQEVLKIEGNVDDHSHEERRRLVGRVLIRVMMGTGRSER